MPVFDKLGEPYKLGDIVVYSIVSGQSAKTQIHVVRGINEAKGHVSTHELGRVIDPNNRNGFVGPWYLVQERKSCLQTPERGVILPPGYLTFKDETHPDMYKYRH